ncbi:hypothetical protein J4573_04505 [Actinomadura barringtoniae]|uniref:MftR C-terminal domain-containing protein n=1 Tax=Actinomadura barringtoniae TaxID=1427535 RepID=A0A939PB32_9ACTN|nr:hypothetical protein [Actinomadura barringtoniae]MBO2446339.1 hypothetical protein [Actinomadura barringtoniae]
MTGTVTLAATAATAVPAASATAATGEFTAEESAMVLQLARAVAVFPVAFPEYWESGPATGRATSARMDTATNGLPTARAELARAGARRLITAGLPGVTGQRFLDGVAEQTGKQAPPDLVAVVALAVSVICEHFAPDDDWIAAQWCNVVRGAHDLAAQRRRP